MMDQKFSPVALSQMRSLTQTRLCRWLIFNAVITSHFGGWWVLDRFSLSQAGRETLYQLLRGHLCICLWMLHHVYRNVITQSSLFSMHLSVNCTFVEHNCNSLSSYFYFYFYLFIFFFCFVLYVFGRILFSILGFDLG